MPRNPSKMVSAPIGNGNSLDASLARAIDAMSHLREDLRRDALRDLADRIDDVLVKCLELYLDRENANPDQPGPPADP